MLKLIFDKTHAFWIRCLTYFDSNFFRMIPMTMFPLLYFLCVLDLDLVVDSSDQGSPTMLL